MLMTLAGILPEFEKVMVHAKTFWHIQIYNASSFQLSADGLVENQTTTNQVVCITTLKGSGVEMWM